MNNDPKIFEEEAAYLLNKKTFFDYIFQNNKKEKSVEKYKIAANLYKSQNKYEEAIRCYKNILLIFNSLNENNSNLLYGIWICIEKIENYNSLLEIYEIQYNEKLLSIKNQIILDF